MIVDLERNDLSRVCLPGTMRWPELMSQQELAGVTHLVSTVEGRLRPGVGLAEILHATFPGGSITGAPKLAAIDHIARFEPVGRGAAMGALGRVSAERRLRARTDDPHVRDRRRVDPPLGRRRHRLGLRSGGGDRGVVGQGTPAARGGRRPRSRMTLLAVAIAGRGLVDPDEPVFRADDDALLRGGAAFETIRVYGGRPFLLADHLVRFRFSAEALALPPPDGVEEVAALVVGAAPPDHVLRLYRTSQALVATAATVPPGLDEVRARGVTLKSFEVGAPPPLLGGAKTTSYDVSFAARRAAERRAPTTRCSSVTAGCSRARPRTSGGDAATRSTRRPCGPGVLPGVTRAFVRSLEPAHEGEFERRRAAHGRRGVPDLVDPRGDAGRRRRRRQRSATAVPGRPRRGYRTRSGYAPRRERHRSSRWHGARQRRARARPDGLGLRCPDGGRRQGRRAAQAVARGLRLEPVPAWACAARRGVRAAPAGQARAARGGAADAAPAGARVARGLGRRAPRRQAERPPSGRARARHRGAVDHAGRVRTRRRRARRLSRRRARLDRLLRARRVAAEGARAVRLAPRRPDAARDRARQRRRGARAEAAAERRTRRRRSRRRRRVRRDVRLDDAQPVASGRAAAREARPRAAAPLRDARADGGSSSRSPRLRCAACLELES